MLSSFARRFFAVVPEIRKVGVCGLGLMGHGIVQVSAEKGFEVVGVEANDDFLANGVKLITNSLNQVVKRNVKKGKMTEEAGVDYVKGVMDKITFSTDRNALADCDLIVEAVTENMDLKLDLLPDLNKIAKPDAILASNTSSFSITEMAEISGRTDKFVGLHFFNPVQMMALAEVVKTDIVDQAAYDVVFSFVEKVGKVPVPCKDTPGFIVNRLLVPYLGEACAMVERGDAAPKDIDTAMKLGCGMPMGPLMLNDYIGLDTILFCLEGWVKNFPGDRAFFVPESLKKMVEEGKLGRKSGEGYFKWDGNKVVEE